MQRHAHRNWQHSGWNKGCEDDGAGEAEGVGGQDQERRCVLSECKLYPDRSGSQ
jgi:hypothetical protein